MDKEFIQRQIQMAMVKTAILDCLMETFLKESDLTRDDLARISMDFYGRLSFKTWTEKVQAYRKSVGEDVWDLSHDNPKFGEMIANWEETYKQTVFSDFLNFISMNHLPANAKMTEEELKCLLSRS